MMITNELKHMLGHTKLKTKYICKAIDDKKSVYSWLLLK